MNNKVTVTANEAGDVVIASKKDPKYGYVRVQQERSDIDEDGWARTKVVSALIHGEIRDLNRLGYTKDQTLPGRVVFKDSLVAFDKKNPDIHLKIAGETGIACRVDGKPIYRKYFYTEDTTRVDIKIEHDNKEEITKANAEIKAGTREPFKL